MLLTLTHREPPNVLKLLANEVRWQLLSLLAYSDYRVNELSILLQKPMNLISYHLRLLRTEAIVQEHRSNADARDVYYSLDLTQFEGLYKAAVESLHPALAQTTPSADAQAATDIRPPTRVLFLCTHNSARSQLAEALLRHLGGERVAAFSAGTEVTQVRPEVLAVLEKNNIDATGLYSKHLDQFLGQDFDYVITVCDNASEACPIFPGDPERIHWSLPDPSAVKGEQRYMAFVDVFAALEKRLKLFLTVIDQKRGAA